MLRLELRRCSTNIKSLFLYSLVWVHLVLSAESVIVGDGYQHPSVDEETFFRRDMSRLLSHVWKRGVGLYAWKFFPYLDSEIYIYFRNSVDVLRNNRCSD